MYINQGDSTYRTNWRARWWDDDSHYVLVLDMEQKHSFGIGFGMLDIGNKYSIILNL